MTSGACAPKIACPIGFVRVRSVPTVAEEEWEADVYVRLGGTDVLAGRLWSRRRGKAESQTFAYDPAYPKVDGAYEIDPTLGFLTGQHQTPQGRAIFGAFSDSSPHP